MVTLMRLKKKLMITGGGGRGGEGDIDNRYSKDAACFFWGERASIHAVDDDVDDDDDDDCDDDDNENG